MLEPGTSAPTFRLPGVDEGTIGEFGLDEEPAEVVVLAFYPMDFSPACTDELCSLRDVELFSLEEDVRLLGISVDSVYSHRAFADEEGLGFPLLSDRLGDVAERYGVLHEELEGHPRIPRRAMFVIDPHGTIQYAWAAASPTELPDLEAVTDAVTAIQDDRTGIVRYREAFEHFQYGRSELAAAREAYEDEQWGLAIETFGEATYYLSEAASGFRSARRFAESEGIEAAAATATETAARLKQAASWYRSAARHHGEDEPDLAAEYETDAEDALSEVEALPPVEHLGSPD